MSKADRISRSLDEGRVTFERRPRVVLTDPVCGMEVRPESGATYSDFGGSRYYFCSEECKRKFDADPKRFVAPVAG